MRDLNKRQQLVLDLLEKGTTVEEMPLKTGLNYKQIESVIGALWRRGLYPVGVPQFKGRGNEDMDFVSAVFEELKELADQKLKDDYSGEKGKEVLDNVVGEYLQCLFAKHIGHTYDVSTPESKERDIAILKEENVKNVIRDLFVSWCHSNVESRLGCRMDYVNTDKVLDQLAELAEHVCSTEFSSTLELWVEGSVRRELDRWWSEGYTNKTGELEQRYEEADELVSRLFWEYASKKGKVVQSGISTECPDKVFYNKHRLRFKKQVYAAQNLPL